ncbi:MAG TPA: Nramp family divalent metal transporter [Nocardioidaceae bacterium]|nr:Nramp family divalent metal transporter [Nocardioidaceae bacterium]
MDTTDTPATGWRRLRQIGPGFVAAATGVGVGDLAASLVAGAEYGMVLLWAVVVGAVVKLAMAEGVGRYHLGAETTLLRGWRTLGSWTQWYFGIYVIVWGFVYGAAVMSTTALALRALIPGVPFEAWAVGSGLLGFLLVWFGRYQVLEKLMTALVGIMFVTVVGTAVLVMPDVPAMLNGFVPRLPEGSFVYVVGLIGGVGGTITMAAYGYWVREKGWRTREWLSVMHLDVGVAYVLTGIFVVAMVIVAADVLFQAGLTVEGEEGLLALGNQLDQRFGTWAEVLFLVGFWATSFTSLLGVWNGVSLFFTDWVHTLRNEPEQQTTDERSPWYRAYVAWLTFPPMLLLFLGQPIAIVITYTVLGAVFMPFLAGTLLVLLNSKRFPAEFRSGWLSNAVLGLALVLFAALCIQEIIDQF